MICNYSIYKKKRKRKKTNNKLLSLVGLFTVDVSLIDIPFSLVYNLPTTAIYSATVNKKK